MEDEFNLKLENFCSSDTNKQSKQMYTNYSLNNDSSFLSGAWLRHCSINKRCTHMSCLLYCIIANLCTRVNRALFAVSAIANDNSKRDNHYFLSLLLPSILFVTNSLHTKLDDCITNNRDIIHVENCIMHFMHEIFMSAILSRNIHN